MDESLTTPPPPFRYAPPRPDGCPPKFLVAMAGRGDRYPFFGRLEIGRDDGVRGLEPGLLLVPDLSISRHHCVVTQRRDGRCTVRDESRNGTRLEGRRLVPHVETPWLPGQTITIGEGRAFALLGGGGPARAEPESLSGGATLPHTDRCIATVLVGDITDYTVMVREALSVDLQQAVRRVYEALSAEVAAHGGTVKEFQGDAILAFWEGDASGAQAARACHAALALDALARRLASDRAIWPIERFPLAMDWALSTGLVLLDSLGRAGPGGLSLMGEPVVRAFRLEKFATAETGRLLACRATREAVGEAFTFTDLGERHAKGFERPDRLFGLTGARSRP